MKKQRTNSVLTFPTNIARKPNTCLPYISVLPKIRQKTAKGLADLIHESGDHLTTGFVGTPFLLHALSDNGYTELAYTLLLQTSYPSWLFSVSLGATTMWEHWDGINENGDVWSKDMNSFNHYAYGAVGDWIYGKACGIQIPEDGAGFAKVRVAPLPDKRIGSLFASIDTRHGTGFLQMVPQRRKDAL